MDHRLRPDIKTPEQLAQAVDHTKLKKAAESMLNASQAMLKIIERSGFQAPELYDETYDVQRKLVNEMAEALCLVLPTDIFIIALQQIAAQEHPKRGGGPAAWKIAKEALAKFNVPYTRGSVLAATEAFDKAIEEGAKDAYERAAAVFFGIELGEVTKDHRYRMKDLLFGHIYGKPMGAKP